MLKMDGFLLSDDLIFTSRITGTARAAGFEVQAARSVAQLQNLLGGQHVRCLVVDLQFPGLAIADLMQSLPATRPFVVAYGSHVDTAMLKAARDAGCEVVLPRSKFVEEMPEALARWMAER